MCTVPKLEEMGTEDAGGQQMLFNTFMLPSIPIEPGAAEVLPF